MGVPVSALTFSGSLMPGAVVIEVATWGRWAHVWAETEHGLVIDATASQGVTERPMPELPRPHWEERFDLMHLPALMRQVLADSLRAQIGTPYDWQWIWAYPLRRNWQDPDAWVCSELIAKPLQDLGLVRFRDDLRRVTPLLLLRELKRQMG